jgi:branched-chain amino acid transport system permease protein
MTVAALTVDWQTITDAIALGAIYALMAVGIGLVFGILRLVNFAYGQLIMAGAFALAITSQRNWPTWSGIVICFGVVLALSLLMDRLVFRPLRMQSPAVMLVATFAVAFLLENIALLKFGALGKIAVSPLVKLNQPVTISGVQIRKITIVAVVATVVILVVLLLIFERTSLGLHMRAAAMDFTTARLLGVRANRVATAAVLISGCLAAVAAILLTVQNPLVTPSFALDETIVVLAGVVLGGLNSLVPATLGGFAIGFASGFLGGALPSGQSAYLPSIVFGAVIVVLLVRPGGLFTRRGQQAIERV